MKIINLSNKVSQLSLKWNLPPVPGFYRGFRLRIPFHQVIPPGSMREKKAKKNNQSAEYKIIHTVSLHDSLLEDHRFQ